MRKLLYIIAFIVPCATYGQHQFHQSQYMHHHYFVNPAAVATFNSTNIAGFYKNQWTGFTGAPTIQGVSIGGPFSGYNAGWGAQIIHDKIGVNNTWDISGTYAYKVQLSNNWKLGLGLSGVLHMTQSNFAEVETTIAGDPMFQESTPMVVMPNFRFGAYAYSSKSFVGLAIPNLLRNQIVTEGGAKGQTSFDASDMHMYIHAGTELEMSRDVTMTPSILFKHVSGTPLQFDVNVDSEFQEKVGVGISYRSSGEFIMRASYNVSEEFLVGYSYDLSFGDIGLFSGGSHEIMLRYKIRTSINEDEPKTKSRIDI